ncbi:MAG: hypothetical protein ACOY3P_17455 [Planctomycetota bacterium]
MHSRLLRGLLPAVIVLASWVTARGESPVQYVVSMKLTRTRTDGKIAVLSRPTLMVTEGHPAQITVGGEVNAPEGAGLSEPLRSGIEAEVVVHRGKKGPLLDMSAQVSQMHAPEAEGVRITSSGLRLIEPVVLGQTKTVTVSATDRWEITVEDARTAAKQARAKDAPAGCTARAACAAK